MTKGEESENSLKLWLISKIKSLVSFRKKTSIISRITTKEQKLALVPEARFSKAPKLFGRISGDIILLVSLKRRRLEARNFAVILNVIPLTTYEKTSFSEYAGRSFTNGFSGPKSFREFRETAPWPFKVDRLQIIIVAKKNICVITVHQKDA